MKKEKAITLVALIVTIIVLLILAGVTLGVIMGENGILFKTIEAKRKWGNAQEQENKILENMEEKIETMLDDDSLGRTIDFGEGRIPVPFEGKGTQKYPYKIYEVSELAYLGMLVNYGISFEGVYFELVNDLNINSDKYTINSETKQVTFAEDVKKWMSIGTESSPFKGIFDGKRHTIKGIYISNTLDSQGLFGFNSGIIRNLNITESYIEGNVYIGGICGTNNEGAKIENCYSNIMVKGTASYAYAGGVCGVNYGNIERCYNNSSVITVGAHVGGICGRNEKLILYTYNTGEIISGKNSSGNAYAGGIVGYAIPETSNVRYSYNIGSITKTGGTDYLGGITGASTYGNIYDSYSSVLSKIVGRHYEGTGKTENSSIKSESEIRSESFIDLIGGSDYWKFDNQKQLVVLKWQ